MAGISLKIDGIEELASAVNEYATTLQEQFTTRLQEIGQTAYGTMVDDSPVDTGFLQGSWSISEEETGFTIDNDCEYCGFVEFGHSTRGGGGFVPGQNWIMPAYEQMRSDIEALISEVSGK
jgi:hypothetical protein